MKEAWKNGKTFEVNFHPKAKDTRDHSRGDLFRCPSCGNIERIAEATTYDLLCAGVQRGHATAVMERA